LREHLRTDQVDVQMLEKCRPQELAHETGVMVKRHPADADVSGSETAALPQRALVAEKSVMRQCHSFGL